MKPAHKALGMLAVGRMGRLGRKWSMRASCRAKVLQSYMMTNDRKLTPKQRCFVEEYLVDLNATKAAVRAGYSPRTAHVIGSENLTKPEILACIRAEMDRRSHRTRLNADAVVQELALLAYSNMLDYGQVQADGTMIVNLAGLTREQAASIGEMTVETYTDGAGDAAREVKRVKVKLIDKKGALELLGRHFGLFPSRHEHAGVGGGPIKHVGAYIELTPIERRQRILELMLTGAERAAAGAGESGA